MKIVTKQFGELEFDDNKVIQFPKGVIGFERCKRFLLVDDDEFQPFRWLVCVDAPDVAFPILNPFLVFPEFGNELPRRLVKKVFESDAPVDMFCIVNLHGLGDKITINLKSPLIIDDLSHSGEQTILISEELSVSHPVA